MLPPRPSLELDFAHGVLFERLIDVGCRHRIRHAGLHEEMSDASPRRALLPSRTRQGCEILVLAAPRHHPKIPPARSIRWTSFATARRTRMSLAMSWDEWATHDVPSHWPNSVRKGDVTPGELARQVAAAIMRSPTVGWTPWSRCSTTPNSRSAGRWHGARWGVRRRALADEGSRADARGPAAGIRLDADAGTSPDKRHLPHQAHPAGRAEHHRSHDHARSSASAARWRTGSTSRATPGTPTTRPAGSSAGTAARSSPRACCRWRTPPTAQRLDPDPGRRHRQHRPEGVARRVLAGTRPLGPGRAWSPSRAA